MSVRGGNASLSIPSCIPLGSRRLGLRLLVEELSELGKGLGYIGLLFLVPRLLRILAEDATQSGVEIGTVAAGEGEGRAGLGDAELHVGEDVVGLLGRVVAAMDAVRDDDDGLALPLVEEVIDRVLETAGKAVCIGGISMSAWRSFFSNGIQHRPKGERGRENRPCETERKVVGHTVIFGNDENIAIVLRDLRAPSLAVLVSEVPRGLDAARDESLIIHGEVEGGQVDGTQGDGSVGGGSQGLRIKESLDKGGDVLANAAPTGAASDDGDGLGHFCWFR